MKRDGFMVGIVSDSYFIAAEIMRKRIFADFAIAHTLHFQNDICTGELKINSDFLPNGQFADDLICKSNVLKRFLSNKVKPSFKEVWAVGDNLNDLNMLNLADRAFVIEPKITAFQKHKHITEIQSFTDLVTAATTAD
jgi:phosphoserine phosphatase